MREEGDRERERETDKERERERERELGDKKLSVLRTTMLFRTMLIPISCARHVQNARCSVFTSHPRGN